MNKRVHLIDIGSYLENTILNLFTKIFSNKRLDSKEKRANKKFTRKNK